MICLRLFSRMTQCDILSAMIRYPNPHKSAAGFVLAAVSVFIWGITFVCTKTLLSDFSSLEILFFRFLAAYIFLWIICPRRGRIAAKDNIYFAAAGLTGVLLYQFLENIAISYTAASNVSIIVSICPMFTALTARIFLHEKHITPQFVAGFAVAVAGVALVSLNGSRELHLNPKGDFLALGSAVCWGFYSLFVSVLNTRNYEPVCCTRRIFFFAVVLMIPLVIAGSSADASPAFRFSLDFAVNRARFAKPLNAVCLLFLGVMASGFCFVAWNKACSCLGTVRVSVGLYLIPVVTVVAAYFVLGEKITPAGLAGAFLTVAGLFLSNIKRRKSVG